MECNDEDPNPSQLIIDRQLPSFVFDYFAAFAIINSSSTGMREVGQSIIVTTAATAPANSKQLQNYHKNKVVRQHRRRCPCHFQGGIGFPAFHFLMSQERKQQQQQHLFGFLVPRPVVATFSYSISPTARDPNKKSTIHQ